MAENSLSGNSISLTYQSVLQVNLSSDNPNPVMDGYGNTSYLTIYKNKPIKINNVIYPGQSLPTNTFATAYGNNISSLASSVLSVSGNDIYYNGINLNLSGIIPGDSSISNTPLILSRGEFGYSNLENKSHFKVLNANPVGLNGGKITFFEGEIPDNLKILRVWAIIASSNAISATDSTNNNNAQIISNSKTGFVGILDGSNFNGIPSIVSDGDCKLYGDAGGQGCIYQFEYTSD